ncbi:hypothetical protein HanRHA438_Chr16g0762531 [Helianthus annuus]|nr:hypothetical protein HanRHA438_Chr16g0762531 [Helianthus annuus]
MYFTIHQISPHLLFFSSPKKNYANGIIVKIVYRDKSLSYFIKSILVLAAIASIMILLNPTRFQALIMQFRFKFGQST